MHGTKRLTMRAKLTLSMWGVMLLLIVLPVYFILSSLEGEVRSEAMQRAKNTNSAVIFALRSKLEGNPEADIQEFVSQAGKKLDMRVTFVGPNGVVRADSRVKPSELDGLDNHINRPEIKSALRTGKGSSIRYSRTMQDDLLYFARRVGKNSILPEGYLRISLPYSRVQNALDRMASDIWAIVVACFVGSALIILLIVRQMTRAVEEMSSAAQAIGQGKFSRRVREVPSPEFQPLADAINGMAEDVEQNLELISKQKIEHEAILNGMKEGVLALDKQGRIQNCNCFFCDMFSLSIPCAGKKPLEIVMHSELQSACDEALRLEEKSTSELLIRMDDKYFDANIVSTPEAKELGAIIVFHDITDLKRVENMRKDFVSNASHELRTPLTSIKGYTETLLGNEKVRTEKGEEMLEVIFKNANSMMRLLDDILQLSRIESDREIVNMEAVDMQQVISKAWSECSSLAEGKDIRFEGEVEEACREVQGDVQGLIQVVRNLLENCLKYLPGENGFIQVLCRDKGSEVWIGIEDSGPGIPPNALERVFERFYRVEKHRNNAVKGTGLGLSICRNILRKISGRIWVESPLPGEDYGTIVWMALKKSGDQTRES